MLVQIQGLNGSLLVGFALNQLSEINEAFSVTTGIDGFILVAALLATKLMKPSEPHHVYGYAVTVTLPTTHLYHVILCWTHIIHLDFILHLQVRLKALYILTKSSIRSGNVLMGSSIKRRTSRIRDWTHTIFSLYK